ncbi:hypothetical protein [Rhizobium sp. L1K21]|uniref:hypothetical protein n=1 Tax=Rhizobium sp. L1K21 TaxID=2954933 RepID=UPI0020938D74|nr:hypothetical protein [Rhizobium sp. L1K21]MCO6185829.1 hypothetical protein [Rhizobium sp. L1K21]
MNNKINGILAASLATLLASGGVMGVAAQANAASADMSQTMATQHQALQPDVKNAIESSNGRNFEIRRDFDLTDQERANLSDLKTDTQHVAAIHSAIGANHALAESLAKQNVELSSVVDVQAAADGGLIIYQS